MTVRLWFRRLRCRLFSHVWEHVPETHECGCIDHVWLCSRCGKTNLTPFWRQMGCPAHGIDLKEFAQSFARLRD